MDAEIAELVAPYGGKLVDLLVPPEERQELKDYANRLPSFQLHERAVCDLELLATGGFSPLTSFMGEADYRSVLSDMRLANGTFWPIPITLPLNPVPELRLGQDITLRDAMNNILAVLSVREIFAWNAEEEASCVIGSTNPRHPLISEMDRWGSVNVAGHLRVLALPAHFDFAHLRLTPAETRARLAASGHGNVVAFQTRNPLHRVHEELTKRAMQRIDGSFLLHPVVGMTRPGDVDHFTRVRTYQALVDNHYPQERVHLSLLPLAMRMAGPREACWHMLIRRNFGANHMIVGRDHAGPGNDSEGKPFYGPFDAQALAERHSDEIGVQVVPFDNMVYLEDEQRYAPESEVAPGTKTLNISGTQVRGGVFGAGSPASGLVYPAGGGGDPEGKLSRAGPPGHLHLVHRPERFRQVHHRQHPDSAADAGGPQGHPAGRRRGAHPSFAGIGLLEGGSGSQRPPHRVRGGGDCRPRRLRGGLGGQSLPHHAQRRGGIWWGRTTTSRCSWIRRWRSARRATPRECTRRPAAVRLRTSRASTIRTRRPSIPRLCWTP